MDNTELMNTLAEITAQQEQMNRQTMVYYTTSGGQALSSDMYMTMTGSGVNNSTANSSGLSPMAHAAQTAAQLVLRGLAGNISGTNNGNGNEDEEDDFEVIDTESATAQRQNASGKGGSKKRKSTAFLSSFRTTYIT